MTKLAYFSYYITNFLVGFGKICCIEITKNLLLRGRFEV